MCSILLVGGWLAVSAGPVFSDDRITEALDSRYTEDGIAERVTEI